jgi:hypothetical protein
MTIITEADLKIVRKKAKRLKLILKINDDYTNDRYFISSNKTCSILFEAEDLYDIHCFLEGYEAARATE